MKTLVVNAALESSLQSGGQALTDPQNTASKKACDTMSDVHMHLTTH